jgi:hypothetical protein
MAQRWLGRVGQPGTWCFCLTATRVALSLIKGEKTLAKRFDVHPPGKRGGERVGGQD